MAKHLQRDASGHLIKNADGHLANGCAAIACDDCKDHGPITCTITTSGGCDESSPGCDYDCAGDVFNLVDDGGGTWSGASSIPGPSTGWSCAVTCTANVWKITVEGGCGDDNFVNVAKWTDRVFVPTGCVMSGLDGYPTHAGINLGNPDTNGDCWTDCVPTVALS